MTPLTFEIKYLPIHNPTLSRYSYDAAAALLRRKRRPAPVTTMPAISISLPNCVNAVDQLLRQVLSILRASTTAKPGPSVTKTSDSLPAAQSKGEPLSNSTRMRPARPTIAKRPWNFSMTSVNTPSGSVYVSFSESRYSPLVPCGSAVQLGSVSRLRVGALTLTMGMMLAAVVRPRMTTTGSGALPS